MFTYGLMLGVSYLALRLYSGFWLLRPILDRPILTRSTYILQLLDLGALTAAVAAFCFLLVLGDIWSAVRIVGALVLADWLARWLFLEIEIRRLVSRSRRFSRRGARHHIRRRLRLMSNH